MTAAMTIEDLRESIVLVKCVEVVVVVEKKGDIRGEKRLLLYLSPCHRMARAGRCALPRGFRIGKVACDVGLAVC